MQMGHFSSTHTALVETNRKSKQCQHFHYVALETVTTFKLCLVSQRLRIVQKSLQWLTIIFCYFNINSIFLSLRFQPPAVQKKHYNLNTKAPIKIYCIWLILQVQNNYLNADNNSIQHSTITINTVVLKPPGALKNEVTGSMKIFASLPRWGLVICRLMPARPSICTHLYSQVERDSEI